MYMPMCTSFHIFDFLFHLCISISKNPFTNFGLFTSEDCFSLQLPITQDTTILVRNTLFLYFYLKKVEIDKYYRNLRGINQFLICVVYFIGSTIKNIPSSLYFIIKNIKECYMKVDHFSTPQRF